MAGPFTTPVAESVPFLSEPDRDNGFSSKNAQDAIEEALALAVSNDVFLVLSQYNGNANVGRHLEFYVGIDSEEAPLVFPRGSNVIAVIARTAATSAICTIGFFDNQISGTVPIYEVIFNGEKQVELIGTALSPLFSIQSGANIEIRITSGAISKPHMQIVFSSSLNGGV